MKNALRYWLGKSKRTRKAQNNRYGCSLDSFVEHIRAQYTSEMTDKNYGIFWHIDHIVPAQLVDLRDEPTLLKWTHFSNQRPLEAIRNLERNAKTVYEPELRALGLLTEDGIKFPIDLNPEIEPKKREATNA